MGTLVVVDTDATGDNLFYHPGFVCEVEYNDDILDDEPDSPSEGEYLRTFVEKK